jgi:hypothetical protein
MNRSITRGCTLVRNHHELGCASRVPHYARRYVGAAECKNVRRLCNRTDAVITTMKRNTTRKQRSRVNLMSPHPCDSPGGVGASPTFFVALLLFPKTYFSPQTTKRNSLPSRLKAHTPSSFPL